MKQELTRIIKPMLKVIKTPSLPKPQSFKIWFDHGLGDCVHFAHLLHLYQRRGYDVSVHYEQNKDFLWKACGIPYAQLDGSPYHQWAYLSGFNLPDEVSDWSGSKIALNFNVPPLPDLGNIERLWDELCHINLEGYGDSLLEPGDLPSAEKFIENLPRPIVLLHTNGTNMPELKNLPADRIHELYKRLLHGMNGSLILLDWDHRVPRISHARVRHLKSDWGHISLSQLYALMTLADLLIGVDSGPYHFASLTKLPVLGIFHHHYPSCVTLPSYKSVNLTRNADAYRKANIPRRKRWNLVEYAGTYPSAEDISRHALRMLEGSRYGLPLGMDIMLQQWIRDWCLASTSLSHLADRNITFDFLLRETTKRFDNPLIVETGCIRSLEDWSAGYSTYLFGAYLWGRKTGKLVSVDYSETNCAFARQATECWSPFVDVVTSDSLEWLQNAPEPIDVLYLDSLDVEDPQCAEHGLKEIKTAQLSLKPESIIIFDDTTWESSVGWVGKGAKAIPWMLENGYKILESGYQVILARET